MGCVRDGLRILSRWALAALVVPALAAAQASGPADPELVVATYNLRYAGDPSPNSWPERRPAVKVLLDAYRPDVIGTQEGLYQQVKDLAADQPDYDWIGLGRDGGSRGDFNAVSGANRAYDIQARESGLSDTWHATEAVTLRPEGLWPSDHLPVVAWLALR